MLNLQTTTGRLCDGLTRRDVLRAGSLGAFGLSLPALVQARTSQPPATGGRARSCIVLFLMGGPPQHSTWDPKPDAPAEIRGEFGPIASNGPGVQVCELLPRTSRHMDKICVLRAVASNDNAHSSSGYYMMTGHPHQPMNAENVNPGPPNNYPNMGGIVRRLKRGGVFPAAMTLPHRIFNTDGSVWPGQDAGMLGRGADPWLFTFQPTTVNFRLPDFVLPVEVSQARLDGRRSLLHEVNRQLDAVSHGDLLQSFDQRNQQAFDLLRSTRSREAFRLDREPERVRERYGDSPFGRSVLLARRLIESGVSLVQVNWYRGPDEPSDNPCWDSHTRESERLRTVLMPPMDQAYAALLEDLAARGMLDETLVVNMAEFGRTPRFNGRAGRDHWGFVYSVALAGGGVRGGQVIGASDAIGGYPRDGRVQPQDLSATIFHALGFHTDTEIQDSLGRPFPISRGEVVRQVF
ncbi:MAG: DUF1501 domain-containing protein [Planctomycetes bacterium]|nr:DUF1501 domain-containing protein [Planctomycetota bacterium]